MATARAGADAPSNAFAHPTTAAPSTPAAEGALDWNGGDGAAQPAYPPMRYDHLRVPISGRCPDPVNFAAWQLLLSMLCGGESGSGNSGEVGGT